MNREIKFRIWNGQEIEIFTLDNNFDCIVGWLENSILMQFTGLKDKNGQEIYEGDIIKEVYHPFGNNPNVYEYARLGLISFQYKSFGMVQKISLNTQLIPSQCMSYQKNKRQVYLHPTQGEDWFDTSIRFSKLEVIGNIYQNPELLLL